MRGRRVLWQLGEEEDGPCLEPKVSEERSQAAAFVLREHSV